MGMSNRERIEAEYGEDIAEVLRRLHDEGLTLAQAGERLGISKTGVSWWARRLGLEWSRRPESYHAMTNAAVSKPTTRWIKIGGRWMTLGQMAREFRSTVSMTEMRRRYDRGVRGKALLAKPGNQGKAPQYYRLGISERDWKTVLDTANRTSPKNAANRFGVPYGAITAMQRGEEWRVC